MNCRFNPNICREIVYKIDTQTSADKRFGLYTALSLQPSKDITHD